MKSFSGKDLEIAKAISEWMQTHNLNTSLESFLKETSISQDDIPKTKILEKKWTTILTMQKKVTDLEQKLKNVKEEYEQASISGLSYSTKNEISNGIMGLPKAPERHCVTVHRAPITCLVFHPIYNLLVSSSEDASMVIWDCSEQEIRQDQYIRAHTNAINNIAFDTQGKLLASCSSDLSIKIWKFDNPLKCIKTLNGHEHLVSVVEFSLDGNLLYSASRDKTIKVWEVNSGFCKQTLKGHEEWVRTISLNESGTLLASAADDETILIWNNKGEIKSSFTGHENKIEKVLFVNNQIAKQSIVTGDYDFSSQQQDNTDNKLSEQMEKVTEISKKLHESKQKKIDKDFLLSCSRDKTIKLWDISNNSCMLTFTGHDNWVRNIGIHPTGKYIISTGDDRNLRVWDIKSGRCVKKLEKVHDKFVVALTSCSKLNYIITGSNDLKIKFWECR